MDPTPVAAVARALVSQATEPFSGTYLIHIEGLSFGVWKEGSMLWPEKLQMERWACGTKTYIEGPAADIFYLA